MENDKYSEQNDNGKKSEKKKRTNMSRPKKIMSIIQLLVLLGIVAGIPAAIYFFNPGLLDNFSSVEKFESWISEYTGIGIIVYIACQVVQIVLSVLPGQVIQIAGGYIFGFPVTLLISIAGAAIGTTITFFLAKLLGKNAIMLICGEERFRKYTDLMNTKRARVVIFLLYLIPGLPKDIVAYAAGVSNIRIFEFLLLSVIGRTPAMMVSIVFGVMLRTDNYFSAVLIAAVMVIIVMICLIKRKSIMSFIEKKEHHKAEPKEVQR